MTLASTADIVPLVGENRVLTRLGLEQINSAPRPGIKALIESSGLKVGQINTGQIVFVLAPRINAAGRLGDAMRAVRLLTATDPDQARELAAVLEDENRNRRKIDEDTFANAQMIVEEQFDVDDIAAIVLHQEHWHPGVVGIVASRMVEKYYKPSIMMATVDGVAKGLGAQRQRLRHLRSPPPVRGHAHPVRRTQVRGGPDRRGRQARRVPRGVRSAPSAR